MKITGCTVEVCHYAMLKELSYFLEFSMSKVINIILEETQLNPEDRSYFNLIKNNKPPTDNIDKTKTTICFNLSENNIEILEKLTEKTRYSKSKIIRELLCLYDNSDYSSALIHIFFKDFKNIKT